MLALCGTGAPLLLLGASLCAQLQPAAAFRHKPRRKLQHQLGQRECKGATQLKTLETTSELETEGEEKHSEPALPYDGLRRRAADLLEGVEGSSSERALPY